MSQQKEIFGIRLESQTIERLVQVASIKHLPVRTMVRSWILDRIDKEDSGPDG